MSIKVWVVKDSLDNIRVVSTDKEVAEKLNSLAGGGALQEFELDYIDPGLIAFAKHCGVNL